MAKVTDLTQEKLNRAWKQLNKTSAKLKHTQAAFEDELRNALLNRARSRRARERRLTKEAHPPPRLTVVLPK
jgi:hypothetical protein